MATTWKINAVRVKRQPEVSLMLADFRGKGDVFDALFDNPWDARLFERRFANQPPSVVRAPVASRRSVSATTSSIAAPAFGGHGSCGRWGLNCCA
jgi:hypothetical protein